MFLKGMLINSAETLLLFNAAKSLIVNVFRILNENRDE